VSGVDTVRGIGYQQAQAVVEGVALLDDDRAVALRIEGVEDVVDLEILDYRSQLLAAKQFKVRADEYTWGQAELLDVMRRWAKVPGADTASFEFITDGRLGPSGERYRRPCSPQRPAGALTLPNSSARLRTRPPWDGCRKPSCAATQSGWARFCCEQSGK